MAPKKKEQGFTLIEVSLAIVIGVVILAGAITLYNQSKVSAGNSKMNDKVVALTSMIESMAASNNGTYPAVASVVTSWQAQRPSDAGQSPWGGSLANGAGGSVVTFYNAPGTTGNFMASAANFTVAQTQAWAAANTPVASAGTLYYYAPPTNATGSFFDANTNAQGVIVNNYVIAGSLNTGVSPAFVMGGR